MVDFVAGCKAVTPKILNPMPNEIRMAQRWGLERGLAPDRYVLLEDNSTARVVLKRKASGFTEDEVCREASKRGLERNQLTQEKVGFGRNPKHALTLTVRNPQFEAAGRYGRFFEKKPSLPKLLSCICLYNEHFQMSPDVPPIKENVDVNLRNFQATFTIKCGPMVWDGTPLKDTYVLEVHYKDSEAAHALKLPGEGFGSMICYDYADVAESLAQAFVAVRGWAMNKHLNSWPQFQAIVSRQQEKV